MSERDEKWKDDRAFASGVSAPPPPPLPPKKEGNGWA